MYAPPAPTTTLRKLYNYASNLHFSKDNKEVNNNTMVERTSEFLDFLNRNNCLGHPCRDILIKILPSSDQVLRILPSSRFSMESFIISLWGLVKFLLIKICCSAKPTAEYLGERVDILELNLALYNFALSL